MIFVCVSCNVVGCELVCCLSMSCVLLLIRICFGLVSCNSCDVVVGVDMFDMCDVCVSICLM